VTALSDAAQAVEDARERLVGWTLVALPNEPGFAGAERLADNLIAAVRHYDAETVRADTGHIRYGSATDYAERHANLLSPAADAPSEVEVRYVGGPSIRIAGYSVTTDAETGTVVVEGFVASQTGQPQRGDAVHLAYVGIPGRGALADVTASVELFTRLDVLHIRIRTTIRPEENR
jgi:hypothetical protein